MSTAELDSTPAAPAPETTGNDETTSPEWFTRVCVDLNRVPIAAGGNRLGGMRAVLTRASWMWDNGQVCISFFVMGFLITNIPSAWRLIVGYYLRLCQTCRRRHPTSQSHLSLQRMGALR